MENSEHSRKFMERLREEYEYPFSKIKESAERLRAIADSKENLLSAAPKCCAECSCDHIHDCDYTIEGDEDDMLTMIFECGAEWFVSLHFEDSEWDESCGCCEDCAYCAEDNADRGKEEEKAKQPKTFN